MRVVHVVTRSHHRGAEVVALDLAAALDGLGHENEVLAIGLALDGGAVADLPPLVPTSRLTAAAYVRGWLRLRRVLSVHPADVVLAHGGSAAILVALPRGSGRAARVWQRILGLPLDRWGAVRRLIWRAISRRFDGVVALSRPLEAEVRALGFRGPVWLIPNARDPRRFSAVDRRDASNALRTQLGLADGVPLIALVGHLVAQKQPELAVDVLAEVQALGQPAHLVIAGDGERRASVERRIAELGMGRHVTLLGHREDPESVYGAADLVLITSRAEGVPGVAIEAHMTGCPVVSFAVGAIGDVVEDGVTGAIIAADDTSAMAQCVSHLLASPRELRSMGAAAASRSAAFTMTAVAPLYAECLAEAGRACEQRAR